MKSKIYGKLKQEYSSLGLGDEILMALAESLAALGLVTDDNIDATVAHQRNHLETLQKANDKRVNAALEKERKKQQDEEGRKKAEAEKAAQEEAERKKAEEAATGKSEKTTQKTTEYSALEKRIKELEKQAKDKDEAHAAALKNLTDSRADLESRLKTLLDKDAANEAAKAKAAFKAKVEALAKEKGIPEWRIKEGFNIAEDATDEAITEVITTAANNINTNLLPGNRGTFPLAGDAPTKEELGDLAANLIK